MRAAHPSVSAALAAMAVLVVGCTADAGLIRCPRDDQLSNCTGRAFVSIIHSMLTGDPERGIPKLDPLLVPLMPVNKNAGEILNINMSFVNLLLKDTTRDVVLESARFDVDKLEMTLGLHRPTVEFIGNYKVKGKILWLPIWGEGPATVKMTDVRETFYMEGEWRAGEGGKSYWYLKKYSSALHPGGMTVRYDNLFNGNWILGKGANALMNSQWKTIYAQLSPITDAHFSTIMKPYWTDILKNVLLDEAFPK